MSVPRDTQRLAGWLEDMREAAKQACGFINDMQREDFMVDARTQQAVAMSLLIVGEIAAKALDRYGHLLVAFPAIPWASMKGMRNRIAHGYFELDFVVVWDTVQRSLPPLIEALPPVITALWDNE